MSDNPEECEEFYETVQHATELSGGNPVSLEGKPLICPLSVTKNISVEIASE